ncbi:MAG: thymidylate synthase [Bacteroidia bacterium]|nr:thymidylate synthase [Bacteroidia bacterium]
MEVTNLLDIHTREDLYRWYLDNHSTAKDFWIRVNRADKPYPGVGGYIEAVEVALCFGWIDSTQKRIDDGKPVQHFTPRRKGGNWCWHNIERCYRLISTGEMTPAGLAVMPDWKPEDFKYQDWVIAALEKDKTVLSNFMNFPDVYKRIKIDRIQHYMDTGRPEQAYKALDKFIEDTRAGKLQRNWDDGGKLK